MWNSQLGGDLAEPGCDCGHAKWYGVTAMSNNTHTPEPVERPVAYEAPTLTVIGSLTELTEGPRVSKPDSIAGLLLDTVSPRSAKVP